MKPGITKSTVSAQIRFIILVLSLIIFFSGPIYAYNYTWDQATGTLTINVTNSGGETIVICVCSGGDVTINGDYPDGVHIHAVDVRKLIVNGGVGGDIIDLRCVDQNTYPNLAKTGDQFNIEVYGGAETDWIWGSYHGDLIRGGYGNDDIDSGPGDDEIHGDDGDDDLYGYTGNDVINGDAGDDYIEGDEGDDTLHGGNDDDEIWGGDGNDDIYGESGYDELDGENGNDNIDGGADDDDIYGGDDDDILRGGDGNDYLFGDHENENHGGVDELYGDAGDDMLILDFDDAVTDGGTGNDVVHGLPNMFSTDHSTFPKNLTLTDEAGNDELDFSNGTRGVRLNLDLLNTPQLINNFGYNLKLGGVFENFTGTPQDDEITIKGIPNFTRNIVCGLQLNADILNFDAEGQIIINTGMALTTAGQEVLVDYEGVEVVNILNPATGVDTDEDIPKQFMLNQNYPNPFNPATNISYTLPKEVNVTLKIFNSLGKEIAVLVNEEQLPGNHETTFDAADLPSGVYFYRLEAGYYSNTKAMLLLK